MVVRVREGIVTCKTLAKDCGSESAQGTVCRCGACCLKHRMSLTEAAELQDFDESMIHGQAFDAGGGRGKLRWICRM